MEISRDYYNVLSTSPAAPAKVIKAAYKAMLNTFHPDKFSGCVKYAHSKTIEIQEAYKVLSNERSRAAYDRELEQLSNRRKSSEMWGKRKEEQKQEELQRKYEAEQEEKFKAVARAKKAESEKKEAENRVRKAENLQNAYFFKLTQRNKEEAKVKEKKAETTSFVKRFLFALPAFLFSLFVLATLILVSFAPSTDSPIEYGIFSSLIYAFYKLARTTFSILTNKNNK